MSRRYDSFDLSFRLVYVLFDAEDERGADFGSVESHLPSPQDFVSRIQSTSEFQQRHDDARPTGRHFDSPVGFVSSFFW